MPIRIPDTLPATGVLESENIFVMTEHRAIHQDIRPLKVLILNLMPLKIDSRDDLGKKAISAHCNRHQIDHHHGTTCLLSHHK